MFQSRAEDFWGEWVCWGRLPALAAQGQAQSTTQPSTSVSQGGRGWNSIQGSPTKFREHQGSCGRGAFTRTAQIRGRAQEKKCGM